jgi:hypothetical protein
VSLNSSSDASVILSEAKDLCTIAAPRSMEPFAQDGSSTKVTVAVDQFQSLHAHHVHNLFLMGST